MLVKTASWLQNFDMEVGALITILVTTFLFCVSSVHCVTDPNDVAVLKEFKEGLENGELLNWPDNGDDPCGPPSWPHIFCSGNRVSQIQVGGLGLKGPLPQNFNHLSMLQNLGLQHNQFSGKLPSFSGLSELRYAFLDYNNFETIPSDFFNGLVNLEVLALDDNPLNSTTGWSLPSDLQGSAHLKNLSLVRSNLAGPLPEFLGFMTSLEVLKLSLNRLTGGIPESFKGSLLRILWLNGQSGGMTGPIDVVARMESLTSLWLQRNRFSGKIPDDISYLVSLQDLNLNANDLVGLIPASLASMALAHLDLNNNHFMGPIPRFKAVSATYGSNPFCLPNPGAVCAPDVMALLEFLDGVNYPSRLVGSWSGNNPCKESWFGVGCDRNGKVIIINLPNSKLSGTLSPSIAALDSLTRIYLQSNNLSGPIPTSWTNLTSLVLLNLSQNNISPPIPRFGSKVKLILDANLLLHSNFSKELPSQSNNTSAQDTPLSPVPSSSSTGLNPDSTSPTYEATGGKRSNSFKLLVVVAPVAIFAVLVCLVLPLSVYFWKYRKDRPPAPSSLVIHPRDLSDSDNTVKIVFANNTNRNTSSSTTCGSAGVNSTDPHVIEAGNLVISIQVLRNVTKNFAAENELGRGGFGVVYRGELDDGTKIAVKRMEAGVISNKALDEFRSEIDGPLSNHLFHWKKLQLEPLSWKRRLNIALDVARGMEYLHTLAHQSFIHRDLKSSNILLGDDFRAKVSDFGLVKLAPDGSQKSVATRLAGTFGYLAPEYAVTGKITTKADVFSFGVVLIELLTGMMALDEGRPEESRYLVAWFWQIKSSKETLTAAIDSALDMKDETFESVSVVSELAGHCTAREPGQRPDMGHAVTVLASLVEKWKPLRDDTEEYCGIDYSLPLNQMVKDWKEAEGKEVSCVELEDSKGSIPARPAGFAESFNSADGR
ncbi:UNVERIFIED_CONTAM: Receptor protein kinase TMK1 [Sesamum latifolium]|uniref:non-specific serine/threonine protein kinase n=1 Tax=Sesamum latifolium TaxID=2727402 RepID=A0AAW2VBA0_9LAMI